MMQKRITKQDFYHFQYRPFANPVASQAPFISSGQRPVINTLQQGSAHTLRQVIAEFPGLKPRRRLSLNGATRLTLRLDAEPISGAVR